MNTTITSKDKITVGSTTVALIGRNALVSKSIEDVFKLRGEVEVISAHTFDNGISEIEYTVDGVAHYAYFFSEMYSCDDYVEYSLVVDGRLEDFRRMTYVHAAKVIRG